MFGFIAFHSVCVRFKIMHHICYKLVFMFRQSHCDKCYCYTYCMCRFVLVPHKEFFSLSVLPQVVEIKLRFEIYDKRQKVLSLQKAVSKGEIN